MVNTCRLRGDLEVQLSLLLISYNQVQLKSTTYIHTRSDADNEHQAKVIILPDRTVIFYRSRNKIASYPLKSLRNHQLPILFKPSMFQFAYNTWQRPHVLFTEKQHYRLVKIISG